MELLVVVMIVVILATIALPRYEKASLKASAMRMLPLMRSIRQAQQTYFLETRQHSCDDVDWDLKLKIIPGGKSGSGCTNTDGVTYTLDNLDDATELKVYSDRVSYNLGEILTIDYHLLGTVNDAEWMHKNGQCHGVCSSESLRGRQICKGFGDAINDSPSRFCIP